MKKLHGLREITLKARDYVYADLMVLQPVTMNCCRTEKLWGDLAKYSLFVF